MNGGTQTNQRHRHNPRRQRQQFQQRHGQPRPTGEIEGILHFREEKGDGQLRDPANFLKPLAGPEGMLVVPRQTIIDLNLRPGLLVHGRFKGRTFNKIDMIEGILPEEYRAKPSIYEATALDPQPGIKLEHSPTELTTRVLDILCPMGFGQRGLIVAPPRTGKTMLMQNIARGIHANYPEVELILLLIDERPEEVTDMRRNVPGTVYASSNDNTVDKHLDMAQIVIERCKRHVEFGKNIVVLMDSLTRLGRNFNIGGPGGGKTLTGGLDNRALEIPKKLFGSARKIENGGSLTIIATCLVDTGSRMDQVIFEEFKGTGNLEITLDRNIANLRIFPAINITESGTRKEEKLMSEKALLQARQIRRHLLNMPPSQAMKTLIEVLQKQPTNQALLDTVRL
ncbi:MAG TPA: transcription termination factor Rho [Tepidisphaeraceae bacterium]|nr:transcription termination factor Rho [Tepidisphaeraceae bacterium]